MKRVNVIIPEEFHQQVSERGLKLSGVVREALEDALNPQTITLSVSELTHQLYMDIMSGELGSDKEFEPFLKDALKQYVDHLIEKRTHKLSEIKRKF